MPFCIGTVLRMDLVSNLSLFLSFSKSLRELCNSCCIQRCGSWSYKLRQAKANLPSTFQQVQEHSVITCYNNCRLTQNTEPHITCFLMCIKHIAASVVLKSQRNYSSKVHLVLYKAITIQGSVFKKKIKLFLIDLYRLSHWPVLIQNKLQKLGRFPQIGDGPNAKLLSVQDITETEEQT